MSHFMVHSAMAYSKTQQLKIDQGQCPNCPDGVPQENKVYCKTCIAKIGKYRKTKANVPIGSTCTICDFDVHVCLKRTKTGHILCTNCVHSIKYANVVPSGKYIRGTSTIASAPGMSKTDGMDFEVK